MRQYVFDLVFGRYREQFEPAQESRVGERFAAVESFWKVMGIAAGCVYALGLLHWSLYLSSYHVRTVELIRVQYFLTGAACVLFLSVHLVVLNRIAKRWWQLALWVSMFTFILFCMDDMLMNSLSASLGLDIHVEDPLGVKLNLIMLVSVAVIPPFMLRGMKFLYKDEQRFFLTATWSPLLIISPAVLFSYILFFGYFFPNIPAVLGGGRSPTVRLYFNESAPPVVSRMFDITHLPARPIGHKHYARLLYVHGKRLFLQPAPWFDDRVYEVDADFIDMLEYSSYNPVERGFRQKNE